MHQKLFGDLRRSEAHGGEVMALVAQHAHQLGCERVVEQVESRPRATARSAALLHLDRGCVGPIRCAAWSSAKCLGSTRASGLDLAGFVFAHSSSGFRFCGRSDRRESDVEASGDSRCRSASEHRRMTPIDVGRCRFVIGGYSCALTEACAPVLARSSAVRSTETEAVLRETLQPRRVADAPAPCHVCHRTDAERRTRLR